jgi:hypothetical protein
MKFGQVSVSKNKCHFSVQQGIQIQAFRRRKILILNAIKTLLTIKYIDKQRLEQIMMK